MRLTGLFAWILTSLFYLQALVAAPVVTLVNPHIGTTSGGEVISLTGTGFAGTTNVSFGSTPASSFIVNSDTFITATAPAGVIGAVDVTVTAPSGTSPLSANDVYVYQGAWFAYVVNRGTDDVTPINTETGLTDIPILVGSTPIGIAITPNGQTAYVVNSNSNNVTPIDIATGIAGTPIMVGNFPTAIAITPDGTTAYVVNNFSGNVTPIDIASGLPGNPITVGSFPFAIAITPNGQTAYVTNNASNDVTPIDIASGMTGNSIPVGDFPAFIAITPNGQTAYVVNNVSNNVTPIDIASGLPGTPIPVGSFPFALAITPNGQTVYVVNNGSDDVTPINIATGITSPTIPVGSSPSAVAITPDGKTAYVVNNGSNNVTPIDISMGIPNAPISVGSAPIGVAITPDPAPFAFFSLSTPAAATGSPVLFDASASASPVGTITNYFWEFGDGQTETTMNSTTQHAYASAGSFIVTLTVTNSAGTSIAQTFTGQTVSNQGGQRAVFSQSISISPPIPPSQFKGKVVKNVFTTQTDCIHHLSWHPSPDSSVVGYQIWRNGRLIAITAANQSTYKDHNRRKNEKDIYTLYAFNANGALSQPVILKFGF